jgi:hypothetical protein
MSCVICRINKNSVAGCDVTSVRFNDRTVFFVSEIIVELVDAMFPDSVVRRQYLCPQRRSNYFCSQQRRAGVAGVSSFLYDKNKKNRRREVKLQWF